MEIHTGKIVEENLVQSAFHQTLGDYTSPFNTSVAYQEDARIPHTRIYSKRRHIYIQL